MAAALLMAAASEVLWVVAAWVGWVVPLVAYWRMGKHPATNKRWLRVLALAVLVPLYLLVVFIAMLQGANMICEGQDGAWLGEC